MPLIVPKVRFYCLQKDFAFADRSPLKGFIQQLFKKEGKKLAHIHYIFCSDAYLLKINKEWLNHHYYTDIISFALSEPGRPVEAEIYISIDRVRDNAKQYNSSFKRELHRVIFHGALHLCGFKDKTVRSAQIMRKMEEKYLDLYLG